ncbi:hypothetical protein [Pseudomonas serbica]|jgi:hypothetical protein|uniref:hypothetical protein n=1 Tax=Pseudomonas serbica TaxID=2965074 RepID=UPI00237BFEC9|nr:hypothetical protein [Pseudomonas serbica]
MLFSRNARVTSTADVVRPARAHSVGRISVGHSQVLKAKAGQLGKRSLKVLAAVLVEIKFP